MHNRGYGDNGNPESLAGYSVTFGNTLSWAGISSLTDAFGTPISNYTITSDSGIDYSRSYVPASDFPNTVPDTAVFSPFVMTIAMSMSLSAFRQKAA